VSTIPKNFRSGFVALVGWPNVGKSSLLNKILDTKLAIVTPKPQTTRDRVLGILNDPVYQMVFLDNPGWLTPKDEIQKAMRKTVQRALHEDGDVIVWVVEFFTHKEESQFAEILKKVGKPTFVVINKADLLSPETDVAGRKVQLQKLLGESVEIFDVSAKTGKNVNQLKEKILSKLPEQPPFYPQDQITDRWERFYVGELIREKIFERFGKEVPHASIVHIDEFRERPGHKDYIHGIIYVESETQKGIIIGHRGEAIRKLGSESRSEIEARLGRPVFLDLIIKVKKGWRKDIEFIRQILNP
jgi:GTP-binding protein Era